MKETKLNRKQAEEKIIEFFSKIKEKTPEEIRKIKKLAMAHNLKLGGKRKTFCQKCFSTKLKVISVKNKIKRVRCENCQNLMRWKIK